MKESKRATEKVIIVTGAGQGIGFVIAREFAITGAKVVVVDSQEDKGKSAVDKIRKVGGEIYFIPVDLRQEQDIRNMITGTLDHFGRVDVVVNNARPYLTRCSYAESLKEWDQAMDVMLKGPALVARHAFDVLKKTSGSIINITSTNAFSVSHQPAAYHVAKAGIVQLTRFLAYEFGSAGIRVNAVCPGLVDVNDGERKLFSNNIDYKTVSDIVLPLQKVPTAERIAQTAMFLCSDAAEFITGQILTVDAGMTVNDVFNVGYQSYQYGKGGQAV